MKVNWRLKHFSELTTEELYKIFNLRLEVFSIEQNCAYQDADGKDLNSFHLMGLDEKEKLTAYSRILPAGIAFKEVSIGRVITSQKVRGTGLGKELMKKSMQAAEQKFGKTPIRIGGQCYLQKFYESFGFVIASEQYLEDNIPHVEMLSQNKT